MRYTLLLFSLTFGLGTYAQSTRKALFLGNSYTAVNNLPQITANIALSTNDTLIYDSNTPGGYTFQGHYGNATSTGKIMAGGWDYVVLQEQSQLPSFPDGQVEADVYPYAALLDSMIEQYNACAKTMFYMTWGRKNGDASNCASWPPVCTYAGMDSLLRLRYMTMANDNQAELSPVGAVWKYIRATYPAIELYQADESHPSGAGSYAAACCFYTAIFKKDPTLVTYNYSLSATDAANIRTAVKTIVYDHLADWNIGVYTPVADFDYTVADNVVTFDNNSENSGIYSWDFGDGNFSSAANPVHTYATLGTFTIQLIAGDCNDTDTLTKVVDITTLDVWNANQQENDLSLFPNPSNGKHFDLVPGMSPGQQLLVTIVDAAGKTWFSASYATTGAQQVVPVKLSSPLPAGIYLVRVQGETSRTARLVVE